MAERRVTVDQDDPKIAAAVRRGEQVQAGAARIAPRPAVERLVVEAVYDQSYAAAAAGAEAGDAMKVIRDVGEALDVLNVLAMPYKITAIRDLPSERPNYCPAPPPSSPWFSGPGDVDKYMVASRSADKKLWVMEDVAEPPACGNTCKELLEAMGVPPQYGFLVRHGSSCNFKPPTTLHRLLSEGKRLWVQSRALGRCELKAVSLAKGEVTPSQPIKCPLLVWPANPGRGGGWEQKLLVVPKARGASDSPDIYPHCWFKLSLRQPASSGGAAVTMHVDPTCGQLGIDEPYKVWHDKSPARPYVSTVLDTVPAANVGLLDEESFIAIAGPLVTDMQGQLQCQWLARILERLGLASRLSLAYVPAKLVLAADGMPDVSPPPGAVLPAWVLSGSGPVPGLP